MTASQTMRVLSCLTVLTVLSEAAGQDPLQPAYLLNTFFPASSQISPPKIPQTIRDPALTTSNPPPPPPAPGLTVFSRPEAEPELPRQGKALTGRFTFQPEVSGPHVRVLKQSPPPPPPPPPPQGPGVSSLPSLSNFPFNSPQFPQITNGLFGGEDFADFLGEALPANQPAAPPPARFPPRGPLIGPQQLHQKRQQLQQRPVPGGSPPPPSPPLPPPSPPSPPPPPIPARAAQPLSRFPVQLSVGPAVPAVPALDQPFNEENELTPGPLGTLGTPFNSVQSVTGPGQPLLDTPISNLIPDRQELGCKTTYVEECHNEYSMVCEDTTVQRDREVCHTVQEKVCEHQEKIDYEPACFRQIIGHCDRVCKRGLDVNCQPKCERSLAAPYCHQVRVLTPYNTCKEVPRKVCALKTVSVPYEKCHDEPKKICEKIEKKRC